MKKIEVYSGTVGDLRVLLNPEVLFKQIDDHFKKEEERKLREQRDALELLEEELIMEAKQEAIEDMREIYGEEYEY